jgi:hypothetical protein
MNFIFDLRKVDLDFCDKSTWKFENVFEVDASCEEIWKVLITDSCWGQWQAGVSKVTWLTPSPYQKGSVRTVKFAHWFMMLLQGGSIKITEYFLCFEENKRLAFRFERFNRPFWMCMNAGKIR